MKLLQCLVLTLSLGALAEETPRPPRSISVTGDAEVKAVPDQFTVRIRIDGRNKEQAAAREQVESIVQKSIASAKILGVAEKDIRTLLFQTRRIFSKDKVKSYEVNAKMSFVLRDVNKAEELVNSLNEAGATSVDGSDFSFSNPRKHFDQARFEAIEAATQKATAAAKQLGVGLGAPLSVDIERNESQQSPVNSRFMANTMVLERGVASGQSSAPDPIIAPGEITVRAAVKIQFELLVKP